MDNVKIQNRGDLLKQTERNENVNLKDIVPMPFDEKSQDDDGKVTKEVKSKLVPHSNLPVWLRDNSYIIASHRQELLSVCECFKSIFRIHSETGNIWTHIVGDVICLIIAGYLIVNHDMFNLIDKLMFLCFIFGATFCMTSSWLFHTLLCHSEKVGLIFNKLDYCGISMLILCSFVPWIYYSFYCYFYIKFFYMIIILPLTFIVVSISLFDVFAQPRCRSIRAVIFVGLGLYAAIPAIHGLILFGIKDAAVRMSFIWTGLMAVFYISGTTIYACQIPERYFPGKFDIILQSHQIFHVFVVIAVLAHFYGLKMMFHHATKDNCLPKSPIPV